jgi:hypothetical protein
MAKRGRRSKLDTDPTLADRCAQEYQAGVTLYELASKYGIGHRRLRNKLIELGVVIRPTGFQRGTHVGPVARYRGRMTLSPAEIEHLRAKIGYSESWRTEPL